LLLVQSILSIYLLLGWFKC